MGGSGDAGRAEGLGQGPCHFHGGSGGRRKQSQDLPLLLLTLSDAEPRARGPCRQKPPLHPPPARTGFPWSSGMILSCSSKDAGGQGAEPLWSPLLAWSASRGTRNWGEGSRVLSLLPLEGPGQLGTVPPDRLGGALTPWGLGQGHRAG